MYMNGITKCIVLCFASFLPCTHKSRQSCWGTCACSLLFLYCFHCTNTLPCVYLHSTVDRRFSCFQSWAITSNAALSIPAHVLQCKRFSEVIHVGGLAESQVMLTFSSTREDQIVFRSSCNNLHFTSRVNILITSHSLQHLELSEF